MLASTGKHALRASKKQADGGRTTIPGQCWGAEDPEIGEKGNMEPRVLQVSEADVVQDIAAVLEKVRQGSEVVIRRITGQSR